MKRILIAAALIIGTSQIATAQTSGSGSSSNAPSVSSSREKGKGAKSKKTQQSQQNKSGSLNQSEMYKGTNGQRATPTGHEATGTNGTAAPMPKEASSDTTQREE